MAMVAGVSRNEWYQIHTTNISIKQKQAENNEQVLIA